MSGPDATAAADATAERFADVADDVLSQAQRAVGLIPAAGGLAVGRRIAIAIALAWLPLVTYALVEGRLLPGAVPEPLLQHFGIHARFLVALPLLILAEATTRASLARAMPQFVARGLVGDADLPAFRALLERARRLRRSRTAFLVIAALVATSTLAGWVERNELHELAWADRGFHFGVFWYSFVSRPLFLLALLAWVWRLGVVGWVFARVSRLPLRLAPTHPDKAAGLGFLERLPGGLAPLFLALALPVAGHWAHESVYHGLDLRSVRAPAAALLLVNVLIAIAPLLAFAPRLLALRREALAGWGALLTEHGRLVERRWIRREAVADDALLAAPELGPVADTVALYETVKGMRAAPIARSTLIAPIVASAIAFVPVAATQVPLKEIAKKLLTGLVGL
jgi:hypothetical protein